MVASGRVLSGTPRFNDVRKSILEIPLPERMFYSVMTTINWPKSSFHTCETVRSGLFMDHVEDLSAVYNNLDPNVDKVVGFLAS